MPNQLNVKNPYRGVNPSQQLSGFQSWLDSVGLTNYQGKYQYQHDLAANQWDAENAYRQFDIDYNSPSNQAALQREAGLNPDLNGVQGFEAGTAGNPMDAPSQLANEVQEPINKVFAGIFNAVQTGLALSQGILSIRGQQTEQDVQRIKGIDDFMSAFESIHNKGGYAVNVGYPWLSNISNKKFKKDLQSVFDAVFMNPNSKYSTKLGYQSMTDFKSAQRQYAESMADPFSLGMRDFFDVETLARNIKDFNTMELDMTKEMIRTQEKLARYQGKESEYNEQLGTYAANADYNAIIKQFQSRIHEIMYKEFNRKLMKGDFLTQMMLNSMLANTVGAFDPMQAVSGAVSNLIPNVGAKFLGGGFSVTHHR